MDAMMRTSWPRWALAIALALVPALGCGHDLVEVPEEQPGKLYCMIAGEAFGHFADGTMHLVMADNESRNSAGCGCFLEEEWWSDEMLAELNELTLRECLNDAAQYDFVWNECQQDYESGAWLLSAHHPEKDSVYWRGDPRCADD